MATIIEERDILFNSFLQRKYFDKFQSNESFPKAIELFVRGTCPSNCKYCYLKKQGENLYPLDCQDEATILRNIELLLHWYIEKKFQCNIDIFSGEIIRSKLLFKIFDIMFQIFGEDEFNIYKPKVIMIPDDGCFLNDVSLIEELQSYIDKFKTIGIEIKFSLSIDGKIMDENRHHNDRTDEYYNRALAFAEKNNYAFHPMVSAHNIEKWIENYQWWKEFSPKFANRLMMLEVRNDDWTPKKIDEYLKFLNYVIDYEFKNSHDSDLEDFAKRLCGKQEYLETGYDNIRFYYYLSSHNTQDNIGLACNAKHNLCIRVGDLSINPCHRTSYDQFKAGHFLVENDKITKIVCDNYEILSIFHTWNRLIAPKCSDCINKGFCLGGCIGSNFEYTHDLFMPPETVCNLFKTKTSFLIMKYESMGLLPYFKKYMPADEYQLIVDYIQYLESNLEENIYGIVS